MTTSLGLEQVRTVADSWRDQLDGGPAENFVEIAAAHPSGMKVVSLTSSPLQTELLDPERVAFLDALAGQAAITINNSALFEDLQRSNADLARERPGDAAIKRRHPDAIVTPAMTDTAARKCV